MKLLNLLIETEIDNIGKESKGLFSKFKDIFKDKRSEFEVDKHKKEFENFINEFQIIMSDSLKLTNAKKTEDVKKQLKDLESKWNTLKKSYDKFKDIKLLSELIMKCDSLMSSIFKIDSAMDKMVAGKYKEEYNSLIKEIQKQIELFEKKL
jgi:hypothetical protein